MKVFVDSAALKAENLRSRKRLKSNFSSSIVASIDWRDRVGAHASARKRVWRARALFPYNKEKMRRKIRDSWTTLVTRHVFTIDRKKSCSPPELLDAVKRICCEFWYRKQEKCSNAHIANKCADILGKLNIGGSTFRARLTAQPFLAKKEEGFQEGRCKLLKV